MREWFEFKGIKSTLYRELIVQELPSITRARKRTEEYYIDGRSGINVTQLGYESYLKQCIIGLTHTENIDEIMHWLDGEGDLTLSNEPDKVYKAEILEQIDFMSLGVFKTAIITWLVYPFKYLKNENAVEIPIHEAGVYAEGNVYNAGHLTSFPLIEIEASGVTPIELNGIGICTLTAGTGGTGPTGYYTIDCGENGGVVYDTHTGELAGGIFEGDFPVLKPGKNHIKALGFTGPIYKIRVHPRSRFL